MVTELKFQNQGIGRLVGMVNSVRTVLDVADIRGFVFEQTRDKSIRGEIFMTSGTTAALVLEVDNISFVSEFGKAVLNLAEVKSLERVGGGPLTGGPAGGSAIPEADLVTMKNGDVLAGTIETGAFGLRTSYGDLAIAAKDIASILMEGGGQNIEMVHLRSGEKISGVLTNEVFLLQRGSGGEMTLQRDKVKSIVFQAER